MEQKDYILREIEKINVLLRYLLGKVISSDESETTFNIEKLNTELGDATGINLKRLAKISPDALILELSANKAFNLENMELLADLLYQITLREEGKKKILLKQALELYRYIDKTGSTYSLERATRIQTVLKLLA